MTDRVDIFATHRPRLFAIAYRMLGSTAEAEDVLQDAYLRWHDCARGEIRSAEAWLTTTVTRLAIDRLRHLKVERDAYSGPWLPEPLLIEAMEPALQAEFRSDVSTAFMLLLESLPAEERAAFILHDLLDDDYADVAEAVGKTQAACRQLVHRARAPEPEAEGLCGRRRHPNRDAGKIHRGSARW